MLHSSEKPGKKLLFLKGDLVSKEESPGPNETNYFH